MMQATPSMIGAYGPWAASLTGDGAPAFSFRRDEWTDVDAWRAAARARFRERVASPATGGPGDVTVHRRYEYDGLAVEELSWQLAYGPRTEALLLKPAGATEALPGLLALHDHGGNKYFGKRKITCTSNEQHPVMVAHQTHSYDGLAWAN